MSKSEPQCDECSTPKYYNQALEIWEHTCHCNDHFYDDEDDDFDDDDEEDDDEDDDDQWWDDDD